jgi:acyl-coenzyme A thioesterase PaaI-like protein
MSLNLTATGKLGDRVIVTAHVAHAGRRTAVVHGNIHRADGKLLGTGIVTIFFVGEGLAT